MSSLTSQSPSQLYDTRLFVWGWWLWNWATAVDVHKIAYKLCTISDRRVGANMKFYIRFPLHNSIHAFHTYVLPSVPRSGRFFYIETVFSARATFPKLRYPPGLLESENIRLWLCCLVKFSRFSVRRTKQPSNMDEKSNFESVLSRCFFLSFFCGKL